MDEEASTIARHIDDERNRLGDTVDALEGRARQALDWRRQFRNNPRAGLGAAFGLGVVAAAILVRRHDRFLVLDSLPLSGSHNGSHSALQVIQTGILSFLALQAREFLAERIGRREEYAGDGSIRG